MSGLFRSEDMTRVQLIMSEESAHETIRAVGAFKKLHIVDSGQQDKPFYKRHKRRLAECIGWEKKLQSFREVMSLHNVAPPGPEVEPDLDFKPNGDVLDAVKEFLDPIERDLALHINFKRQHNQAIYETVERAHVLKWCRGDPQFMRNSPKTAESEEQKEDAEGGEAASVKAATIVGLVLLDKQTMFERMVFRVSKGNAFLRFAPLPALIADPLSEKGEMVQKSVFCVVFVGDQVQRRIKKICSLFGATTYEVPQSSQALDVQLAELRQSLSEQGELLNKTAAEISRILASFQRGATGYSPLVNWERVLREEKLISDALRRCYVPESDEVGGAAGDKRQQQNMVVARGWVPSAELEDLKRTLAEAARVTSQQTILQELETRGMPPTYFRLTPFTSSFQAIVDTYGVPRYQEVNPGMFTIVTFPFLFGVMYGDIFHGSMLTLFALFLLFNEKKFLEQKRLGKLSEMMSMVFGGRYLLILMGLFALYCGTLYNDCASIPLNTWGSGWNKQGSVYVMSDRVYPWGLDPAWAHKTNELNFYNSVKMKLAIILGVAQMSFGITLGLFNHLHFRYPLGIFFEFMPRLLFLTCTFGYMCFIIVFKMFVDWSAPGTNPPPSLIQTMIGMFLSPGNVSPDHELYTGQAGMQAFLLLVAVISVPLMLFPIPCIKNRQWKKKYGHLPKKQEMVRLDDLEEKQDEHHHHHQEHHEEEHEEGGHGHGEVGPNYSMSDELIGLSIHTIEFVLGAISNTASYLRLWALSLAHAELSKVFWEKMIMQYGVESSPVLAVAGWAIWAASTFGVLLCMDVLECFLHALRLHWVEFQNKFYNADGYKFQPFDISKDFEE